MWGAHLRAHRGAITTTTATEPTMHQHHALTAHLADLHRRDLQLDADRHRPSPRRHERRLRVLRRR